MQQRLACFAPADVLRDDTRCCNGAGFGCDMGGDGHIGMGPIGMVQRQWLHPKDIKRCVTHLTAVERGEQGVIVNQRTTTRIDEARALGQQGKLQAEREQNTTRIRDLLRIPGFQPYLEVSYATCVLCSKGTLSCIFPYDTP